MITMRRNAKNSKTHLLVYVDDQTELKPDIHINI